MDLFSNKPKPTEEKVHSTCRRITQEDILRKYLFDF